jgi:hypothetical protein
LKDNNYNIICDDKSLDFLEVVLKPKNYFLNNKFIIQNILVDKNSLIDYLNNLEHIIVCYFDYVYLKNVNLDKNIISIVSKSDNNTLLNIISIIEEELPKLKFNVNYKLWLDSFFAKLIVGG